MDLMRELLVGGLEKELGEKKHSQQKYH